MHIVAEVSEILMSLYAYMCGVRTGVCLARDRPGPLNDKQTLMVLAPLPRTSSTVSTLGSRCPEMVCSVCPYHFTQHVEEG